LVALKKNLNGNGTVYKSFGVEIEKLTEKEKSIVPRVVLYLVNYLIENHLEKEKGIFRISSQKNNNPTASNSFR